VEQSIEQHPIQRLLVNQNSSTVVHRHHRDLHSVGAQQKMAEVRDMSIKGGRGRGDMAIAMKSVAAGDKPQNSRRKSQHHSSNANRPHKPEGTVQSRCSSHNRSAIDCLRNLTPTSPILRRIVCGTQPHPNSAWTRTDLQLALCAMSRSAGLSPWTPQHRAAPTCGL
jgi:hypothetical protein